MRIEGGKIKPCPTCLKARQKARDMFLASTGKMTTYTLVECEHADFTIENATHKITAIRPAEWNEFVGRKVYLSGKTLYDVEAAKPIGRFGAIIKVTKTN